MTSDLLHLPDGRQAQYWSTGPSGGPAVFFLHGCPDTRHAAYPGARAAHENGVRLVAVNRPGYGASTPHASDHLTVADDVAAVADQLGIGEYAVLGMSVGGPYALACAARHPRRVRAVAVVASPANTPELDPPYHRDDLPAEQQEQFRRLERLTVNEAAEVMRPEFEAYVALLDPGDPDEEAMLERYDAGLHPLDAELVSRQPAAERVAAVREALVSSDGYLRDAAITFRRWAFAPAAVECPVAVWHGELDRQVSRRNADWLVAQLPSASLTVRPTAHLTTLHNHWAELLAR